MGTSTTPGIAAQIGPLLDNPLGRGGGPNIGGGRNVQVIPNVTLGNGSDNSGQLNPGAMNALAASPSRTQAMVASLDSIIPIVYGGPERIAGRLYIAKVDANGYLLLAIILCEGEVEKIGANATNDMAGIYVNDVDGSTYVGLGIRKHVGTAGQAADALLTAAITAPVAFAETLANTAYIVVQVPPGGVQNGLTGATLSGFPRIVSSVLGKKVFDPRQNLMPFSNLFSSWSTVGGATATQNLSGPWGATNYAWTITDNNAAALAGKQWSFAIVSSAQPYVWVAKVLKTSGGVSKTVGIDVTIGTGGAPVVHNVRLNTDTGGTSGGVGVSAVQKGVAPNVYWLVSGTITDNASGNTTLAVQLMPATANNGSFVDAVATTGSAGFCEVQVRKNSVPAGYIETPGAAGIDQPTVWSDNSALCLGDFLASTSYGEGRTVDAQSLATAAEYCDEMCGSAGLPNEKRSRITLTLDSRQPVRAWRDVLRAYVPCWVVIDNGKAYLRLDRDEPVDVVLTADNIRSSPLPKLSRTGIRDTPNAVVISYTDTSVTPNKTATVEQNTGGAPRRATRIDMPGIRSYSQAKRGAILRLNHYTLEDVTGVFPVFDDGLKILLGDIVQVTDDVGLAATSMRVLGVADEGHGRWTFRARKHDPAVYTNAVVTTPTTPTMSPPDANSPPAVTGLVAQSDRRQESGVWVSRVRANWNPVSSSWPFLRSYLVELFDPANAGTYTWAADILEVTFNNHNRAVNDMVYLDITSGGAAALDGTYRVSAVPDANHFRVPLVGSGAAGNVTWRKQRESQEVFVGTEWISQPVLLDIQYFGRVRVISTLGVVGP